MTDSSTTKHHMPAWLTVSLGSCLFLQIAFHVNIVSCVHSFILHSLIKIFRILAGVIVCDEITNLQLLLF